MTKRSEELMHKYLALCHAMQSGVAMEMNSNPQPTTPKHLRVGVNSALVECSALVRLLISKEIITEEEYFEELVKGMQDEVDMYTKLLSAAYGSKVTLA